MTLLFILLAFTALLAAGACKAESDGDNRKERDEYQHRNDLKGGNK